MSKEFNPLDYFSPKEQRELLRHAKETRKPERNYILLLSLGLSYRRVSELLHIKVKDINFNENMLQIGILKRRKKSIENVKVSEVLINEFENYIINKKLTSNDYLFKSSGKSCSHCKGGHLTRQRVDQILKMICFKAFGVDTVRGIKAHAHRYRKSAVINYVRKKIKEKKPIDVIELRKIQRVLKIKNFETVFHYAVVTDTRDEEEFIKEMEEDLIL